MQRKALQNMFVMQCRGLNFSAVVTVVLVIVSLNTISCNIDKRMVTQDTK